MSDPRELLRRYGAPEPLAIELPTEIRSDGGLKFQLLSPPSWATRSTSAVILEWCCELDLDALEAVSTLLKEPNRVTGMQAEQAINQALKDKGLGDYLGTFIDEGRPPYRVRMVIGVRTAPGTTEDQMTELFAEMFNVPPTPTTVASQAAEALRKLREYRWCGQGRSELRLMLLSQTNIETLKKRSIFIPGSGQTASPSPGTSRSSASRRKQR